MNEFADRLHSIIQNAFRECNVNLKHQLYMSPEKCRIALPQPMINILDDRHRELLNSTTNGKYNGVQVIPGYENALVIYHIDWLYVNDPAMIYKVAFSVKTTTILDYIY